MPAPSKTPAKIPHHEPGGRISEESKAWFFDQVLMGHNPYTTGKKLGISRSSVRKLLLKMEKRVSVKDPATLMPKESLSPQEIANRLAGGEEGGIQIPDPITIPSQLPNKQALEAWHNFGYWRVRYLGRRHIPWQVEMVQILMSWWASGQETSDDEGSEIIKGIINTPPGGGKTTTVTHDFPGWVATRNRDIRVGLGSRTGGQATKYVRRLRTTFERNVLLNIEFGRFKPLEPGLWRQDQFTIDGVVGHEASINYKLALAGFDPDDPAIKKHLEDPEDPIHEILAAVENAFLTGEKEPTVSALSQEMGFLGGRYDLNLWDDLCDRSNSRTPDQREGLSDWWFAEAESRCEPGGIVGLIGTRYGKYDLYRHARDLTYSSEDEAEDMMIDQTASGMTEEQLEEIRDDIEKELVDRYGKPYAELATPGAQGMKRTRPVYRYHRFPAHDEHKCQHPESLRNSDHIECVLDTKRFNFRHLLKVQAADPRKFQITYQQEDESTQDNLVQTVWLTGGSDQKTKTVYPGCYDYSRRLLQIPDLNKEDCYSIATVDPSAQNWWSIQWWIWDAKEDIDYLIDLLRVRIHAGGFLDWDMKSNEYRGILDKWQNHSIDVGWPIAMWIVEQNATQRYLFQYKWVHEWMRKMKTLIKGHETSRNKADPEYGLETIAGRFEHGLVNLPYDQGHLRTRVVVNEFAKELTEYPDSLTDDMVAGYWFHHFNRQSYPDSLKVSNNRRRIRHPYEDSMPDNVKERFQKSRDVSRVLSAEQVKGLLSRTRR